MSYEKGEYGYPVKPECPGKPTLQAMSESLAADEAHQRWHREHPGELCPDRMLEAIDHEAIQRGVNLLNALTFEPGDAITPGGRK